MISTSFINNPFDAQGNLDFKDTEDVNYGNFVSGSTPMSKSFPAIYAESVDPSILNCASFMVPFSVFPEMDNKLAQSMSGYSQFDLLEAFTLTARCGLLLPRDLQATRQMVRDVQSIDVHVGWIPVQKLPDVGADSRIIPAQALQSVESLLVYLLATCDSVSVDVTTIGNVLPPGLLVHNLGGVAVPQVTNYYVTQEQVVKIFALMNGVPYTLTPGGIFADFAKAMVIQHLNALLVLKMIDNLDFGLLLLSGALSGYYHTMIVENGVCRYDAITGFGTVVALSPGGILLNRMMSCPVFPLRSDSLKKQFNLGVWLSRFWYLRERTLVKNWRFNSAPNSQGFVFAESVKERPVWNVFVEDEGARNTLRVCAVSKIDKIVPSLNKGDKVEGSFRSLDLNGVVKTVSFQPLSSWKDYVELVAWGNVFACLYGAGTSSLRIGTAIFTFGGAGNTNPIPLLFAAPYLLTRLGVWPSAGDLNNTGGRMVYGFNVLLNVGAVARNFHSSSEIALGIDSFTQTNTLVLSGTQGECISWFTQFNMASNWSM